MELRPLGRTGVRVSSLALGTMNLGSTTPEDESIRIVHRVRKPLYLSSLAVRCPPSLLPFTAPCCKGPRAASEPSERSHGAEDERV